MKKVYSKIGLALFVCMLVAFGVQIVIMMAVGVVVTVMAMAQGNADFKVAMMEAFQNVWFLQITNAVSVYGVGMLVYWLMVKKMEKVQVAEKKKMSPGQIIGMIVVGIGSVYLLNMISLFINGLIAAAKGITIDELNPLSTMIGDTVLPTLIFTCLVAPIAEELIFREIALKRLRVYGDWIALIFTSVLFGMMHGNLAQIPYGIGLGLLLGFIVIKTNQLKYSIILHMAINFSGGIVFPQLSASENTMLAGLAVVLIGICIIMAVILLWRSRRLLTVSNEPGIPEERGKKEQVKEAFLNVGTVLFILYGIAMCLLVIIQA